jgi:hypothetical protein
VGRAEPQRTGDEAMKAMVMFMSESTLQNGGMRWRSRKVAETVKFAIWGSFLDRAGFNLL